MLLSVTLVLFFGEIIPSAVFTGPAKLRIAAAFKPFVDVLLALLAPLAYPIALALDRCIPEEAEVTTRAEVRALVQVQHEEAAGAEPFNSDEAALVHGALSLTKARGARAARSRAYSGGGADGDRRASLAADLVLSPLGARR